MSNEIKSFEHKTVGYSEELLKNNFVEARFTNNERTWIEVLTNEKGDSLTSTHIEFDENAWQYKALMTVTDIEFQGEATRNAMTWPVDVPLSYNFPAINSTP